MARYRLRALPQTFCYKCDETMSWLDNNQLAEVESPAQAEGAGESGNPIISKLYQGAPPTSTCREEARGGSQGPTIEEVD
ncbi:hypothetical protein NQD34_015656 [Periophthalmus magnuspinnatus]|nr:hypothetical protein NQD34_015656 [Periophthalmus magnuspinnatus]